jgi:hypothetical protein
MPEVRACEACGYLVSTDGCYLDPFLTGVWGYVYCSQACRDWHINSK